MTTAWPSRTSMIARLRWIRPLALKRNGAVDPGEARGLGQARGRERAAALAARLGDQRADRGDPVVGEAGQLVRRSRRRRSGSGR